MGLCNLGGVDNGDALEFGANGGGIGGCVRSLNKSLAVPPNNIASESGCGPVISRGNL